MFLLGVVDGEEEVQFFIVLVCWTWWVIKNRIVHLKFRRGYLERPDDYIEFGTQLSFQNDVISLIILQWLQNQYLGEGAHVFTLNSIKPSVGYLVHSRIQSEPSDVVEGVILHLDHQLFVFVYLFSGKGKHGRLPNGKVNVIVYSDSELVLLI